MRGGEAGGAPIRVDCGAADDGEGRPQPVDLLDGEVLRGRSSGNARQKFRAGACEHRRFLGPAVVRVRRVVVVHAEPA